MANRDVEIGIYATDEASAVMRSVTQEYKAGSQSIREAMQGATQATDAHSTATNKLKDFIRAEREENRLQNFLFRESKDVIGAAALGLSAFGFMGEGASGHMKHLTDSLQQGFVTFQGFGFLLSSFGVAGPIGLAISGIAGIAAAMVNLGRDTKETTDKVKEQKEAFDALDKSYESWVGRLKGGEEANQKVSQLQQTLLQERLNILREIIRQQEEGNRQITIFVNDIGKSTAEVAAMEDELNHAIGSTIEQNRQREKELVAGIGAVSAATREVVAETREIIPAWGLVKSEVRFSWDEIHKYVDESRKQFLGTFTQIKARMLELHVGIKQETLDIGAEWRTVVGVMKSATQEFSGALYEDITKAFHDAFGEAHSVLQKFLYAVLDAISRIVAELAATGAMALIGSLLSEIDFGALFISLFGIHGGGEVPKAHRGMFINAPASKEFPILVRGGETVRTERQEEVLQGRVGTRNVNLTVNFNAPVSDADFVVASVKKALRQTGLTVNQLLVDDTSTLILAR